MEQTFGNLPNWLVAAMGGLVVYKIFSLSFGNPQTSADTILPDEDHFNGYANDKLNVGRGFSSHHRLHQQKREYIGGDTYLQNVNGAVIQTGPEDELDLICPSTYYVKNI
jgi:hypothetical protein